MPVKHGFGGNIAINKKAEISKATEKPGLDILKLLNVPQGKILPGRQRVLMHLTAPFTLKL